MNGFPWSPEVFPGVAVAVQTEWLRGKGNAMGRKRSEVRTQFLHDVMITALEGGVGDWSAADDIVRHDNDDLWYRSYVLFCTDGGREPLECGDGSGVTCKGHKVDPEVIAKGVGLGTLTEAQGNEKNIGWHISQRRHVILANRENDAGEIDAFDASCITQLGIFGNVVFS